MISTNVVLLVLIAALLAAVILVLRSAGEIVSQVLVASERCCGQLAAAWKRAGSGGAGCCCCGGGGGAMSGDLHNPQLDKGMYEIYRDVGEEQDVLMGVVSAMDMNVSNTVEYWVVDPSLSLSLFTELTEQDATFQLRHANVDPAANAVELRNAYASQLPGNVTLHNMNMDWEPRYEPIGPLPTNQVTTGVWAVRVRYGGSGNFDLVGYVHASAGPGSSTTEYWLLMDSVPFPLEGAGRDYEFTLLTLPAPGLSVAGLYADGPPGVTPPTAHPANLPGPATLYWSEISVTPA